VAKPRSFLSLAVLLLLFIPASSALAESFEVQVGRAFAEGNTLEVEEALTRKIAREPGRVDLWLDLAGSRKSEGDYEGAVAAYRSYLSRKDDWKVRTSLALALAQKGEFADAGKLLEELHREHPEDPDVLWGLARLRLYQSRWKSIRVQAGSHDALVEAQELLLNLNAVRPDFALFTWQLAEVSRALGDTDRALKAYLKVLQQDPSYKLAHRHIAKLLAQAGKEREALAKYEQAIAIEPEDPQLQQEARAMALKAPEVAQKRKAERLHQWRQWTPPEQAIIAASPVTVRVGLFAGQVRLLLRSDSDLQVTTPAQTPITVLPAGQEYRVLYEPAKDPATVGDVWVVKNKEGKRLVTFTERIWMWPTDPKKAFVLHAVPSNVGYFYAKEEDRAYRGILEISPRAGTGFQVLNRVTLEDHLAGVLPAEMPSSWPMEALKAQAIVARTYVLSKMGRHNDSGFDVCDNVHCEVYRGLRGESQRSNEAVRQTAGLVLKAGSKLVPVAFSAQCGGHTQDYVEAWGHKAPVVGVEDYDSRFNKDMEFPLSPSRMEKWVREDRVAHCRIFGIRGYQNYRWASILSAAKVQAKAGSIGRVRRLKVTHRSSAGWADRLLVEGETGSKELKGDFIRRFLGGIRSNLIWIEPQFNLKGWPEEFVIYGGGWGHGVGLCQVGCLGLARGGKDFERILRHYFPKADIKKLEQPKTN
jgi:stage II sporulation protein D